MNSLVVVFGPVTLSTTKDVCMVRAVTQAKTLSSALKMSPVSDTLSST